MFLKKYLTFPTILLAIFSWFLQLPLLAQEIGSNNDVCSDKKFNKDDVKCFDLDQDNYINLQEYLALIKHKKYEIYRLLDEDRDGKLFDKEQEDREHENELIKKIEAEVKKIEAEEEKFQEDFEDFADNNKPYDKLTIDEAIEIAIGLPAKSPLPNLLGFQIREKYEDIRAFSNPKEKFSRFNEASFSFTSDFENDNDILLAKGAIFRPIKIVSNNVPNGDGSKFTGAVINPGISFDRIDNSNSDDEDVDILEFRLGFEFEFLGGKIFESQYLRAGLIYETNFGFDQGTFGGELQWQPFIRDAGNSAARKLGPISYRWRPIIHLEGGEDYLRIGPKLSLEIWPDNGPLERFTFSADYEFFQTLIDDSDTRDLLNLGLSFRLDENGNTTFRVGYRTGEVALDAKDVDELSLGFGVKF